MLFYVDILDYNLDDITGLEKLGGMLDKSVGHLGDMEKSVVVNADINEATEVDYVTDGALKLHTGAEVGDIENVGRENGSGSIIADVSAGLLKLGDNIKERRLTASELASELCGSVLLNLESEERKVAGGNVLGGEIKSLKKIER